MVAWMRKRPRLGAWIGQRASPHSIGAGTMNIRFSRWSMGLLAVATLVLMADSAWAIRQGLGPSPDDWGLKYNVTVEDNDSDMVTVVFTVADDGRLKPIYSIDLVAFSKQTDGQGGRSYDANERIELKSTADGKRSGQAQIRKEFLDRAKIRLISLTFDGKRQPSGGVFYDIPVKKYLNNPTVSAPQAAPRVASPPSAKVKK
jgi:hypothetical protein